MDPDPDQVQKHPDPVSDPDPHHCTSTWSLPANNDSVGRGQYQYLRSGPVGVRVHFGYVGPDLEEPFIRSQEKKENYEFSSKSLTLSQDFKKILDVINNFFCFLQGWIQHRSEFRSSGPLIQIYVKELRIHSSGLGGYKRDVYLG
jgi:hypothetical protein